MDHDDWRAEFEIGEENGIRRFIEEVREREVVHDAARALANRVAVTHNGQSIFAYAATRQAAEEARRTLGKLIKIHGLEATSALSRWHHVEEQWEDADVSLPRTPAELARERKALRVRERQESEEIGFAAWDVCIEMPSRGAAVAFAELHSAPMTFLRAHVP